MNRTLVSRLYAWLVVVAMPIMANAALVNCGNPSSAAGGQEPCTINDLFKLLVGVFNWLLGMGAIVAFIFLIYGGIRMFMYSVDEENIAIGKKTVIEALIGLAIIGLSYVIINTLLHAIGVTNPADYLNGNKLQAQ